MSTQWEYQIRIYLGDEFAEMARSNPDDPAIKPLVDILSKHNAIMKCQFDAFTGYVTESERYGTDTLDGAAGDDTVLGGDDDDMLTGGEGNDVLVGGAGQDLLTGGDGDDILFIDGDDLGADGGDGADTLALA